MIKQEESCCDKVLRFILFRMFIILTFVSAVAIGAIWFYYFREDSYLRVIIKEDDGTDEEAEGWEFANMGLDGRDVSHATYDSANLRENVTSV